MELFKQKIITQNLIRIDTPFGVSMYLVKGNQSAALIDTGMGVGSLKKYIDKQTSLPYVVYLTHGHCDHAGGASEFETVYLNSLDWELEKSHSSIEHRISDVFHGPMEVPSGITEEMFVPQRTKPYLPLNDMDVVDLGGVHIQFVAVVGHTQRCLVPIVLEDRIAIIGDALGETTLMHFAESATIERYRHSLIHLKEFENEFDVVLRFHGTCESKKQILDDSIELCDAIMNRTDAKIPFSMHDMDGLLARPKEHLGKEGNIVYNPKRILE